MSDLLMDASVAGSLAGIGDFFRSTGNYLLIFAGFSLVIFFHELGHFMAAKAFDVRVERFAVGFGKALCSWRKGLGFRMGSGQEEYRKRLTDHVSSHRKADAAGEDQAEPTDMELAEAARKLGLGETEYCFNVLPLGGYVKMLGQEDFEIDKSGEMAVKEDPRAFTHKPVWQRMIIVSAGVTMNLIFAAVVFMMAFMIGVENPPAEVGYVIMDTPAYRVGLRPGDVITEVNGTPISDYYDLKSSILLADPDEPVRITYLRKGADGQQVEEQVETYAEQSIEEGMLQLGVAPPMTNEVIAVVERPDLPDDQKILPGDTLVSVNGEPAKDFLHVLTEVTRGRGRPVAVTVERPAKTRGGQPTTLSVPQRASIRFIEAAEKEGRGGHLLGLLPRTRVRAVEPGTPADEAGLRGDDVIVRFGNQDSPTNDEIVKIITDNGEKPISMSVLRKDKEGREELLQLTVTPRVKRTLGLFGSGPPKIGASISGVETDRVVVADVIADMPGGLKTPAAAIRESLPRGAVITRVDDEPVANWLDLIDRFIAAGGKDVKLSWRYGEQPETSGTIHVPSTLGTADTFTLPPDQAIIKIAGKKYADEEIVGDRPVAYPVQSWRGAQSVLKEHLGEEVKIEYGSMLGGKPNVVTVKVTPEMLDTWVQRVTYEYLQEINGKPVMRKVQVSNPIAAMGIGLRKTYHFIEQVYVMIQRMVIQRTVGLDQVSGPVGIVKVGSQMAEQGWGKLLYYLAMISANLAVLNFLPLPIVDGGLFVFLLIEKIKGSPISLKVQVATQVIGLALIIGIFLFVTFNDITRVW